MRIYDWASDVKDQWFIDDGIHFTSQGYAARGRFIADALLEAFPDGGDVDSGTPDNCLINPDDTKAKQEDAKKPGKSSQPDVASTEAAPIG
jgi:hypothetical protein